MNSSTGCQNINMSENFAAFSKIVKGKGNSDKSKNSKKNAHLSNKVGCIDHVTKRALFLSHRRSDVVYTHRVFLVADLPLFSFD